MPTYYDDSLEQSESDNTSYTSNLPSTDLGQNDLSCIEVSVDFGVSAISLSIVHKPPMEHPIMTTRTRSGSFSDSQHGSESLSGAENLSGMVEMEILSEGDRVATGGSNADFNNRTQVPTKENSNKKKSFESEYIKSSKASSLISDANETTEPLAVTLARHTIINKTRNKIIISPPSFLSSSDQAQHTQPTTNTRQLSFFQVPEPTYGLHQTEDGVTVYLTDDVTLKFFSIEAEEIENALEKLPTIAPKLKSLIEKAEGELSQAVNCLVWDLSGKKLNGVLEAQEKEDETQDRNTKVGLDIEVSFRVTATCLGKKMAEMSL